MENVKSYVIYFVEGRVDADEFIKMCQTDQTIFDWIQSIVPKDKIYTKTTIITEPTYKEIREKLPYDIRLVFEEYVYNFLSNYKCSLCIF